MLVIFSRGVTRLWAAEESECGLGVEVTSLGQVSRAIVSRRFDSEGHEVLPGGSACMDCVASNNSFKAAYKSDAVLTGAAQSAEIWRIPFEARGTRDCATDKRLAYSLSSDKLDVCVYRVSPTVDRLDDRDCSRGDGGLANIGARARPREV